MTSGSTRRRMSLAVCGLAYLGAFFAAAYVVQTLYGLHPMIRIVSANLAAIVVLFTFSVAYDNSSLFDPYWSVAPPLIGWFWWVEAVPAVPAARQGLVLLLVCAWAIRLTGNWVRGWEGLGHEDWRYRQIREQTGRSYWLASLVGIHLVPGAIVLLACVPLRASLASGTDPIGWLDAVAAAVMAGAVTLEAVADEQLRRFRTTAAVGTTCDHGLWAYSRHPNYFGETAFWWGLALFGIASGVRTGWVVAGAVTVTVMFVLVSIPMLDRRSVERRPGYAEHMRRVSRLVPWFPAR